MKQILEREFIVQAPLEKAWTHLAEIENWPSWAGHIRSIVKTPPGPLCAHTQGAIHLSNGVKSTFLMTEFQPPRRWKWVGLFLGMRIHYDHVFEPIGADRTRIRFILQAEGWSRWLVAGLFARIYRTNLDRAIPCLIKEINLS